MADSSSQNVSEPRLLEHGGWRIVGDEDHLWTQHQQALDVDLRQLPWSREPFDTGHQSGEAGAQLFRPVGEYANDLRRGRDFNCLPVLYFGPPPRFRTSHQQLLSR